MRHSGGRQTNTLPPATLRCATRVLTGEEFIVKICILASSSSGNCTFIGTERTRILVDAGLSRKSTFQRLAAIGERPESIDAVLVTHEHTDHVSGLALISCQENRRASRTQVKREPIPIYMTALTAPTIPWADFQPTIVQFQAGTSFTIGDIEVQSFTIPHDASDPVGFCFKAGGVKIGLVTDLGYIPESVKFHLRGTQLLLLESNHDLEMLKVGPYPWSVKQRVMGRRGHLSNDVASDFVRDGLDASTHILVLGHLSEHNNHPEIARITAMQALADCGIGARLVVAEPGRQSEIFQF